MAYHGHKEWAYGERCGTKEEHQCFQLEGPSFMLGAELSSLPLCETSMKILDVSLTTNPLFVFTFFSGLACQRPMFMR